VGPELLGVIGTTVSTIFVALFGYLQVRDKRTREIAERAEETIDELREDLIDQRHRLDVATQYIYQLRAQLAAAGLMPPEIPPELAPAARHTK
jgi:hypothetical protein